MASNVMGFGSPLLAILVMILFNANNFAAAKSDSNSSFHYCTGSMKDCRIGDNAKVEFLFESELATQTLQIGKTLQPFRPAADCGRGKAYTSCLPDPHNAKILERCYDKLYVTKNRGCALR